MQNQVYQWLRANAKFLVLALLTSLLAMTFAQLDHFEFALWSSDLVILIKADSS